LTLIKKKEKKNFTIFFFDLKKIKNSKEQSFLSFCFKQFEIKQITIIITRDMITIKGKREENRSINSENYFVQELYWGAFSRIISLPEEIDPEESEAVEKHGLLIIKLPKVNKEKKTQLKVKSI
jgi:hypothetical protein